MFHKSGYIFGSDALDSIFRMRWVFKNVRKTCHEFSLVKLNCTHQKGEGGGFEWLYRVAYFCTDVKLISFWDSAVYILVFCGYTQDQIGH